MTDARSLFYDADVTSAIKLVGGLMSAGLFAILCCWVSRHLIRYLDRQWDARAALFASPTVIPMQSWHDGLHIASVVVGAVCAWIWLGSASALVGFVFVSAVVLALARIDAYTGLLPDALTQALLWTGMLFHSVTPILTLEQALWGVFAGYLPLWLIACVCQWCTGRPAMGHGDFKFAAALGAWVGGAYIPVLLFAASCMASVVLIARWRVTQNRLEASLPFGPFLAVAGVLCLFACLRPLS